MFLFFNIMLYRKPLTAEIRMTSCSETSSLCFLCCRPTSLDAFVFGYLAPLYKAGLPSAQLQQHLKQLHNLCQFCTNILKNYFSEAASGKTADCGLVLELWHIIRLFRQVCRHGVINTPPTPTQLPGKCMRKSTSCKHSCTRRPDEPNKKKSNRNTEQSVSLKRSLANMCSQPELRMDSFVHAIACMHTPLLFDAVRI